MEKLDPLAIGNRIKNLRIAHHYTQEEFSEHCQLDLSTVQRTENGLRTISTQTLANICTYFNISADYILFGKTLEPTDSPLADFIQTSDTDTYKVLEKFSDYLNQEIKSSNSRCPKE